MLLAAPAAAAMGDEKKVAKRVLASISDGTPFLLTDFASKLDPASEAALRSYRVCHKYRITVPYDVDPETLTSTRRSKDTLYIKFDCKGVKSELKPALSFQFKGNQIDQILTFDLETLPSTSKISANSRERVLEFVA